MPTAHSYPGMASGGPVAACGAHGMLACGMRGGRTSSVGALAR